MRHRGKDTRCCVLVVDEGEDEGEFKFKFAFV